MISQEGKKRIVMAIAVALIFLLLGFYIGSYITLRTVASIASGFIDWNMVEDAVYRYQEDIKSQYPLKINGT